MSTSVFPVTLDTYTNPTATSTTNSPSLSAGQTLQNDSLAALESVVGITNSAIASSLTYQLNQSVIQTNILKIYASTTQTDTGSATAYSIAPAPVLTAYVTGQRFTFYPANANTGAATLNVNSLGVKAIQYGGLTMQPGYMAPSILATVIYDGTAFQLQNPATTVLAYSQITSSFTTTSVSTAVAVTGLSVTVFVPAGKRVKIESFSPNMYSTEAGSQSIALLTYQDGSQIGSYNANPGTSSTGQSAYCMCIVFPSAGSHTYSSSIQQSAAGTMSLVAVPNSPAFIIATLI